MTDVTKPAPARNLPPVQHSDIYLPNQSGRRDPRLPSPSQSRPAATPAPSGFEQLRTNYHAFQKAVKGDK